MQNDGDNGESLASGAVATSVRGMNLSERITVDPEQCGGKPCIRGMRIRVKDVLEMLGSGMTDEDTLTEFPY